MIRSFRHRGLKRLYERGDTSRVNPNQLRKIEKILSVLDAATEASDMDLPGFQFHALRGDMKEFYAVSVSGNWRIVFRFDKEPEDVDLVDYH
jgi:proteic killer suppression protein